MELTEAGIQNVIDIVAEYTEIIIDKQFILDNYDKFAARFPEADDAYYRKEYADEDVWWTFAAEANSGGIGDTSPRDSLMDTVAEILFGTTWPLYGDTREVREAFDAKLQAHLVAQIEAR